MRFYKILINIRLQKLLNIIVSLISFIIFANKIKSSWIMRFAKKK